MVRTVTYVMLCTTMMLGFVLSCEASEENGTPLNRVDFTSVYLDNIDTDRFTGIFGYTRSISSHSNLTINLTYLDSRFGSAGGSGFGDTTFTFAYLPNAQMSVAPWLPRIVGSGISVTVPTGNENQGRGLGSTVVTPFLGTRIPLSDSFSFTPTLAYAYSTDQIITGKDVRVALFDLGLTWTGKTGWWASLYAGYIKDFESDNTSSGGRLSAGKVFANGLGLSAHYIDLETFRPGLPPQFKGQFDQVYEISLQYGF